jgi:hypothetical protein
MVSRALPLAALLALSSCGPSAAQANASELRGRDRVIAEKSRRIEQLEAELRASKPNLQAAYWAGQIEQRFQPTDPDDPVAMTLLANNDELTFAAILAAYNGYVFKDGMGPSEAYLKAVSNHGPRNNPETANAVRTYIKLLKERKAQSASQQQR